jgi:hypothetical protein
MGVDKRNGVYADVDVVAKLRQQVRYITVDRGENAHAFEVHLRLVLPGVGLRETRLGTQALRFQRLDLPQRLLRLSCRLHRRFLLMQLGRKLPGTKLPGPSRRARIECGPREADSKPMLSSYPSRGDLPC